VDLVETWFFTAPIIGTEGEIYDLENRRKTKYADGEISIENFDEIEPDSSLTNVEIDDGAPPIITREITDELEDINGFWARKSITTIQDSEDEGTIMVTEWFADFTSDLDFVQKVRQKIETAIHGKIGNDFRFSDIVDEILREVGTADLEPINGAVVRSEMVIEDEENLIKFEYNLVSIESKRFDETDFRAD